MRRLRTTIAAIGLILTTAAAARADLQITIDNATLTQGRSTTLNVTITNTGGPQTIDSFGFEFRITTTTGNGRVEFAQSQPLPYGGSTAAGQSIPYIFTNNGALDSGMAPGPQGQVSTTSVPNDTYIGDDYTADGAEVTLNGPRLLTELTILADPDAPPVGGNIFQITLIPNSSVDPNTFFANDQTSAIPYTVRGGTVTYAAVPAPASLPMLGLGLAPLALRGRRRFGRAG